MKTLLNCQKQFIKIWLTVVAFWKARVFVFNIRFIQLAFWTLLKHVLSSQVNVFHNCCKCHKLYLGYQNICLEWRVAGFKKYQFTFPKFEFNGWNFYIIWKNMFILQFTRNILNVIISFDFSNLFGSEFLLRFPIAIFFGSLIFTFLGASARLH